VHKGEGAAHNVRTPEGGRHAGAAASARIVRHGSARAFLSVALPLIERDPAAYGGLVAWARMVERKPGGRAERGMFWTVQNSTGPLAFALQREQGPLVIGDSEPTAAALLAESLAPRHAALPGLMGSFAACEAFARTWRRATGRAHRLRFHLQNYVLGDVPAPAAARGSGRRASASEIDLVVAWLAAFVDEARVPDDKAGLRASAAARIEEGKLWLWHDRVPRAVLGFIRVDETTGRIVSVYTPPEHRGRGYAKALTACVANVLRASGCTRIHLTADRANRVSNALYASVGFVAAGEHYHFDFVAPRRA
jgi:predicted GNAT family acetyltransferase